MWDRVVQPMIRAIEDACGTYEGGELVIHSQQSGQYDKTIENKIEEFPAPDSACSIVCSVFRVPAFARHPAKSQAKLRLRNMPSDIPDCLSGGEMNGKC